MNLQITGRKGFVASMSMQEAETLNFGLMKQMDAYAHDLMTKSDGDPRYCKEDEEFLRYEFNKNWRLHLTFTAAYKGFMKWTPPEGFRFP